MKIRKMNIINILIVKKSLIVKKKVNIKNYIIILGMEFGKQNLIGKSSNESIDIEEQVIVELE